jgi:hypothetical protein
MLSWINFLIFTLISILVTGFIDFLKGYFGKKGENAATKEDVSNITKLVESVKLEHADKLEKIKSELLRGHERDLKKYRDQYDSVKSVWGAAIKSRNIALSLRPELSVSKEGESEAARRIKLTKEFADQYNQFSESLDQNQPFIPQEIYDACIKIRKEIFAEGIDYAVKDPEIWTNYWKKAQENQAKILESVFEAGTIIRRWLQD